MFLIIPQKRTELNKAHTCIGRITTKQSVKLESKDNKLLVDRKSFHRISYR